MSEPFRSAVAFRNDICNFASELALRLTRPLPNGAAVYVTGPDAVYRLFKDLGSSFDDLGTAIVVPTDGTANRWVQESANGASPWSGVEVAEGAALVTPTDQFEWTALGSTDGDFALATGDALMFEVDPATSEISYHGVTRQVTLRYQVSLLSGGESGSFTAQAAISVNNDVPAGDTNEHRAAGEQAATVSTTVEAVITGERSVLLQDGATIRLMLRNMDGSDNIEVEFFSLSIAPS